MPGIGRAVNSRPSSVVYGLARLTTGCLSLVLLGALTRVLHVEDLGRYAVVLSVVSFGVVAGFQGLSVAILRLGPAPRDRSAFLAAISFAAVRRIPVALVAVVVVGWWLGVPFGFVALALVLGQGWFELAVALAVAESAPVRYWVLGASRGLLCVVGASGLGALWGAVGAVLGTAVGFLVSGLVVGRKALRLPAGAPMQEVRELERLGRPLSAAAVLNAAAAAGDRLLLAALAGVAAAGHYAPSYDLAQQAIWALLMVATQSFYPTAVMAFEGGGRIRLHAVLSRHLAVLTAVGLPAAVGLGVLAPHIGAAVLGTAHARAAATLLPIIAAGVLLGGIKAYYADVAHQLARRPGAALTSAAAAAGVNFSLNLWLIPSHGALGAAWATLGAYAVGLGVSWFLARFHLPLPLPARELAKSTAACGVMAGAILVTGAWSGPAGLVGRITVGVGAYLAAAALFRSTAVAEAFSRRPERA